MKAELERINQHRMERRARRLEMEALRREREEQGGSGEG